jgi:competence protein ComEA
MRLNRLFVMLVLLFCSSWGVAEVTVPLKAPPPVRLDINTATAADFAMVMKGVGQKRAQAIVAWRKEHGPFKRVEDLQAIKGIGPATIAKNRAYLTVRKAVSGGR